MFFKRAFHPLTVHSPLRISVLLWHVVYAVLCILLHIIGLYIRKRLANCKIFVTKFNIMSGFFLSPCPLARK